MNEVEKPEVIKTRPCRLCNIELTGGQAHLSLQHCVKDLRDRVEFLRKITLGQAKELDWERTAIQATHRVAYIILSHFTKKGRVHIGRSKFEKVNSGAGITLSELPDGDFEVVAVLPDVKKQETPS